MRSIKKDAMITFVKNDNPESKELSLDAEIFSVPYSKILQAEQFCETEELEYCYVGFKDYIWHVGTETHQRNPIVKVTAKGIDKKYLSHYIINISEV